MYIEITQKFQLPGANLRKMGESIAHGWIITTKEGIVGGIVFYVTKLKLGENNNFTFQILILLLYTYTFLSFLF